MPRTKESLKYLVCLFKMKGHDTWRVLIQTTMEQCQAQLTTQLGKNEVTEKKYFEIDRLTGEFKALPAE